MEVFDAGEGAEEGAKAEAGGGRLGVIPLVELTKMQGNSTCPPILWISRWKNALPTLRAI